MGRLDRVFEQGTLRRWDRALSAVEHMDPAALKSLRRNARALSARLDRVLHLTEARLATAAAPPKPLHSDWAWRPELWSGPISPGGVASVANGTALGREAKLYHDCPHATCSARQIQAADRMAGASYGLRLDVYQFAGSFFSIAIDLPHEAVDGLTSRHLLRVAAEIEFERPVQIYCRLNQRIGPNVAQLVRHLDENGEVDLDLSESDFDEKAVSDAWIDLIFDAPEMNRIILHDVTLSRRPRAEI